MDTSLLEYLLNEEESTSLDFKRDQYPFAQASDEEKSELLKDILAFANAWRRTDAYILIGVEEVRGGRSRPVGVAHQLDDSSLQQFVHSKVQRPVTFSYAAAVIDGIEIGVITVPQQDRPFYLRKDYGKLKQGVVYIRRGSSTDQATADEVAEMGAARGGAARPQLSVVARLVKSRDSQVIIGIKNAEGASPARAPYLSFEIPDGFKLSLYGVDGNGSDGLPHLAAPGTEWRNPKFKGDANTVIHGGTEHLVTRIEASGSSVPTMLDIQYEIAAENAPLTRNVISVDLSRTA